MLKLKYRYCKVHMAAYLNGELSPPARRRMARYIAECPECYAEYRRQRQLMRELQSHFTRLGRPEPPQLDRIRSNIQTDIDGDRSPASPQPLRSRRAQYGVVMLVLLLTLLLPWTLGNRNVSFTVPSQPSPEMTARAGTPEGPEPRTRDATVMLVITDSQRRSSPRINLRNTPAPSLSRR